MLNVSKLGTLTWERYLISLITVASLGLLCWILPTAIHSWTQCIKSMNSFLSSPMPWSRLIYIMKIYIHKGPFFHWWGVPQAVKEEAVLWAEGLKKKRETCRQQLNFAFAFDLWSYKTTLRASWLLTLFQCWTMGGWSITSWGRRRMGTTLCRGAKPFLRWSSWWNITPNRLMVCVHV